MAVEVTLRQELTIKETLTANVPFADAKGRTITHNALNQTKTLTGATSQAVTQTANFEIALVAGSGEIDLRDLLGTNGIAVDGNGLKVQTVILRNKSTNANPITIEDPGAGGETDGYPLLGDEFKITLKPGQSIVFDGDDKASTVSGTSKILELTGTDSQVLQVSLVLG